MTITEKAAQAHILFLKVITLARAIPDSHVERLIKDLERMDHNKIRYNYDTKEKSLRKPSFDIMLKHLTQYQLILSWMLSHKSFLDLWDFILDISKK